MARAMLPFSLRAFGTKTCRHPSRTLAPFRVISSGSPGPTPIPGKLKAIDDENKRKDQEHKDMAEKGLLKQILIEAKIVEATEEFVRNLGVQWGFGNQQKINAGSSMDWV